MFTPISTSVTFMSIRSLIRSKVSWSFSLCMRNRVMSSRTSAVERCAFNASRTLRISRWSVFGCGSPKKSRMAWHNPLGVARTGVLQ